MPDDSGGVWTKTAIVLALVVYAGMVLTAVAGFRPAIPLVVLPPVLLGLIAGNSLLGGARHSGKSSGTPPGRRSGPPDGQLP
ncbi:MAG: hypothetical protein ACYCVN_10470 [Acidimicrobiales bacterium]